MKDFSSFNIKVPAKGFEGDKIKIKRILNTKIVVHAFKIDDSKCFKERGTGKCLSLQISINETKHVLFTGSGNLIEMIQSVPPTEFPFTTTIIQENERYLFT